MLSHDATTLDTSIAAGGDGDGALEPGETFALDERLANAGEAGARTVRGTLTGASLAMTQGSAAWLDLAAGETGDEPHPLHRRRSRATRPAAPTSRPRSR